MDVTLNLLYFIGTQVLCWNIYYATVSWLNGWELNFPDIINKNNLCLHTDQILSSDVCICSLWNAMAPLWMRNTLRSRSLQSEARVILISVPCTYKSRVNLKGHIYILILFKVLDCLYNKNRLSKVKKSCCCIPVCWEHWREYAVKWNRWKQNAKVNWTWVQGAEMHHCHYTDSFSAVLLDKSLPVHWMDSQAMSTLGISLDPTATWKFFFRQLLSTIHWKKQVLWSTNWAPKLTNTFDVHSSVPHVFDK